MWVSAMQWTTRTWIWKVMMWRDTSASSTQISQTVFVCTIMHKNVFFGHFCFLLLFLMMMMIPVLCKKLMLLQWYSSYFCFFRNNCNCISLLSAGSKSMCWHWIHILFYFCPLFTYTLFPSPSSVSPSPSQCLPHDPISRSLFLCVYALYVSG